MQQTSFTRTAELSIVAICALGLEEILAGELSQLGVTPRLERGAVAFRGGWADVWRANWRLRTANRVLVELATWRASDGDALYAGARAFAHGAGAELLHPDRTFALASTATGSEIRDTRWVGLRAKDGIVDGQRQRWGRRASVDRQDPDLPLRVRLHEDRATLLLETSGEALDHRGYRAHSTAAPVREQLAAACVLASGWNGQGPVVDPMCGSGTLLIEAAWFALGKPPGCLRRNWAFERFPGFDARELAKVHAESVPAPGPGVRLYGNDQSPEALRAATANLERAGLTSRTTLLRGDAADLLAPPDGPGLVVVNPPYGERVHAEADSWKALGDLLKRRFAGWRAVVLAGGEGLGKHIGLRPRRRIPVRNGPLDARILLFDLY